MQYSLSWIEKCRGNFAGEGLKMNGKERDTGMFLCGGMNILPDFTALTQEEMEILAEKD